jgi:hypothetical protein
MLTRHATRRTLLKGAGATLVLPFLPSALPREAWGAAQASPPRFVAAVVPNGIFTPAWQPQTLGPDFEITDILTPAAALKPRLTVVSGLKNLAEEALYAEHTPAMGSILTDTAFDYSGGVTPNGISVDQVVADHYGAATPFRSLQFGVDNAGAIETPYTWQISWGNADTPFPPILQPRTMFNRMFGSDQGLSPEEIAARGTIRGSILDRVRDRTIALKTGLSTADLQKLDQYETGVRELEVRLDWLDEIVCEEPEVPGSNPAFAEATSIMYDLMFKAFECDLTRVMTFLQGQTVSDQVYTHLDITAGHHTLSHSGWGGGQAESDYKRINQWQFEMYCSFIQKLADTEDTDGNDMLSNTICLYTTEFSDSNSHLAYGTYALPMAVMGGENLGIVNGTHRFFPEDESHGSLLLTLLHHAGIEQDTFGDNGTTVLSLT